MTTVATQAAHQRPAAGRLPLLARPGRAIVLRALAPVSAAAVTLIEPDGRTHAFPAAAHSGLPRITVRIHDWRFFSAAALGGALGIAEAYLDGWWTTDDLPGLIQALTLDSGAMTSLEGPIARLLTPIARAGYWLRRNTIAGSRRNIAAHYDLSNDFFALFLDPSMTYSCAIFDPPGISLEAAQTEKIDRACRRLGLQPHHHLIEIGTGWGALAIHAATRFGCRVTTTTISDRQFDLASQRIRDAGLSGRITILRDDYRRLPARPGFAAGFDRLVSIEMIEAVGAANLPAYFAACSRLLKPDGAALIQAIVIRDQHFAAAARRVDFLKKYIFPGSCLPSVSAMLTATSRATDLRAHHIEEIGHHYPPTLAAWRARFLANLPDIRAMGFDDRFSRMWEYYFSYCEGVFRAGRTGDVQLLLAKPRFAPLPAGPGPEAAQ